MSSYVKYLEGQGVRVVPIIYDEDFEIVKEKISKLNGVLYPGGGGNGLYELGGKVLKMIEHENDKGNYYPAWGICLGYEFMVGYTADIG